MYMYSIAMTLIRQNDHEALEAAVRLYNNVTMGGICSTLKIPYTIADLKFVFSVLRIILYSYFVIN